jgi:predicted Zn-dependent protease
MISGMGPARIIGVLIALVGCAWFGLGIRQAQETTKAAAIVSGTAPLTTGQISQAGDLLHAAQALNPDTDVDVLRAKLDRDQNELAAARNVLEQVVAKEPDNAVAWLALAESSRGTPRTFLEALGQVRRLAPPVPQQR